jgi:hypothetical protein
MTYNFEMLDDERFQQLAQTLITSSFPNAQCLPVGQPDGGRDAFTYLHRGPRQELIIFQVKYSRNPQAKSERDSIEELIQKEKKKIIKLIERGASQYYFITNVGGTSHLDIGSIDRINESLSKEFEIPCYCWWRDDLVARINAQSDVKWSFVEILKASDVLQMLTEGVWREASRERIQTLKSYIAAQSAVDADVKFKQVDLHNKLLDLFVDTPIDRAGPSPQSSAFYHLNALEIEPLYADEAIGDDERRYFRARRPKINAAEFLLNFARTSQNFKIVLEGAPGQGKSTITQYVCQVHRLKILASADVSRLPKIHREAALRVPFRIDLRDFASWLTGRNPFVHEGQGGAVPSGGLESFIAAQVGHTAGGQEFSPADFIAVTRSGRILVVLDGFDEVADVQIRNRVVDEITKGAARIQAHQSESQIVVTSRPAAFANSPGFSHEDWHHLEIQAMTGPQIDEYSQRWMTARSLALRERDEFSALLKEKLEQPHMRDLARNPMQLAILLSLIHTRGTSLPDKRTALYDNYVELFFNRESEKK